MRSRYLSPHVIVLCVAAVLLTACGGSQPPIGAAGAMPQSHAIATHGAHGKSWMLPEAKNSDLVYAASRAETLIYVYSYPGMKLVGQIPDTNGELGLCSDSAGNVFVTNSFTNTIDEYTHGGTNPIATFSEDPYKGAAPRGCAVDPSSGALAVANEAGSTQVAVFPQGSSAATYYSVDGITSSYFCVYDARGDLFVDGAPYGSNSGFGLAELAAAQSTFSVLTIDKKVETPGALQWDGKHITLASISNSDNLVYRVRVYGSSAHVIGTTALQHAKHIGQSWFLKNKILAPFASLHGSKASFIGSWPYPKGGAVKSLVEAPRVELYGLTVSLAPHD